MINNFNGYVAKEGVSKFRYRLIPQKKIFINGRTPVGEPAEYFERKPYGGRKQFEPALKITNGVIAGCYGRIFNSKIGEWEFFVDERLEQLLVESGIPIPATADHGTIIRYGDWRIVYGMGKWAKKCK